MKVTWLGHSCFKIEIDNISVIFDPYADNYVPGLSNIREKANYVFCSHGHDDHNYKDGVEIIPTDEYLDVEEMNSFHDPEEGRLRGENKIRIINYAGIKIAHLGDLGCELNKSQIKALINCDLLLIPVGGYFTIDFEAAYKIVKQLDPKAVIPMHFKDLNAGFGYDIIDTVDPFIELFNNEDVLLLNKSCVREEEMCKKIIVLKPELCKLK